MNAQPSMFNPTDPAFVRDPYPFYRALRSAAPVWKSPLGAWVLTRYDDIATLLKDGSFVHDFAGEISDTRKRRGILEEPVYASLGRSMLVRDPPDHTRLRGLVARAFTARRVEEMRPGIEAIVKKLLDAAIPNGKMDLIEDFSHTLPVIVICDMLGLPEEDRGPFLSGYRISGRAIDPVPMTREELDEANSNTMRGRAYFGKLFERRRAEPGDDLTSALLQVRDEQDGRLSDDELYSNISLLFAAGHETTANLIANGMLALLRNRGEWERLVADPALAGSAVEEILRYDSSVQLTTRKASKDVEIGGQKIARGEDIICLLGAGNRDPQAFEDPEKLDISRKNVRPLSFGGGVHTCLGAQLARIEAEVAFRELAKRLPHIQLDDPENPVWKPTITLRRLESLPVHWAV